MVQILRVKITLWKVMKLMFRRKILLRYIKMCFSLFCNIWYKNVFSDKNLIIFFGFFETNLICLPFYKLTFFYFYPYFKEWKKIEKISTCSYYFLGPTQKSFMSLRWFGSEKSLVKVDQVQGGVHPRPVQAITFQVKIGQKHWVTGFSVPMDPK